jgi:mannose-1-phosphate guanylyltransferase
LGAAVEVTAAVVLAGGPGTRLGELGVRMPKTMIEVAGRPYLEHLAARLLDAGLRPVVIAMHHHEDMIRDHFVHGRRWVDLALVHTGQHGTGADLLHCLPHVPADAFVVWNGDTVVDLDLSAVLSIADGDPERGMIVLTRLSGVPNEGAFYVADDGVVLASLEAVRPHAVPETFGWRGSSTGVLLLRKSLLASFSPAPQLSLEATVLPGLVMSRQLRAFDNGARYFLDFGTPAGLKRLIRDQIVTHRVV